MARPDENSLQGDFGETWLEVAAASCGLLHGRPDSVDLDKCDVQLTLVGEHDGTYSPTVRVQVKTALQLRRTSNGDFTYDLDVKTYDVLRHPNHSVRRALAVFEVGNSEDRLRLTEDGTLLIGRGAWVSLEGEPASANSSYQSVTLPATNTIDASGLGLMLKTFGTRRSTQVPTVDPWRST
jgi:hypothetical protein